MCSRLPDNCSPSGLVIRWLKCRQEVSVTGWEAGLGQTLMPSDGDLMPPSLSPPGALPIICAPPPQPVTLNIHVPRAVPLAPALLYPSPCDVSGCHWSPAPWFGSGGAPCSHSSKPGLVSVARKSLGVPGRQAWFSSCSGRVVVLLGANAPAVSCRILRDELPAGDS